MSDGQDKPIEELDDDELLQTLRSAAESNIPIPDSMVDMIMAGYDITNLDTNFAELVEDVSLADAAVRSGTVEARLLTFRLGELSFEFEIGPTAPEIVGHLDAASSGFMRFEQADHAVDVELDDHGRFEFTLRSRAPFRLRYIPADGTPVATDWILP